MMKYKSNINKETTIVQNENGNSTKKELMEKNVLVHKNLIKLIEN